jgi:flagellar hook-basal body complex protein FliE
MNDMPIKPMEMILPTAGDIRRADRNVAPQEASFGQWLQKSMEDVNKLQRNAENAANKLVAGENKDIHGTMIAMQKANISMSLMLEVRNKIISAYDEIKRMQF